MNLYDQLERLAQTPFALLPEADRLNNEAIQAQLLEELTTICPQTPCETYVTTV